MILSQRASQVIDMDYADFMRLNCGSLETSCTTYRKEDCLVTLLACDHLAEEGYFRTLEDIANLHDVVIYEPFSRGEGNGRAPNGLISQEYAIDYASLPEKWVNGEADITPTLRDRLAGALVSLLAMPLMPLFARTMRQAASADRAAANAAKLSFLTAFPLRQFNSLVGLSTEARRRAATGTFESLESPGKSLAFLYGAGHAPYLEQYLLDRGYVETRKEWLVSVKT